MSRVLIAGMGNILRGDDGLGILVAHQLLELRQTADSPLSSPQVKIVEMGIGGIHLVQELMDGYEILVVIDALERGGEPGSTFVLEAEVPDLDEWAEAERQDFLADMHYTTPSKALILAKALHILPPRVFLVGCQPVDAHGLGIGLSEPIQQAIAGVVRRVEALVADALAS